jgi:hypothetical protein
MGPDGIRVILVYSEHDFCLQLRLRTCSRMPSRLHSKYYRFSEANSAYPAELDIVDQVLRCMCLYFDVVKFKFAVDTFPCAEYSTTFVRGF